MSDLTELKTALEIELRQVKATYQALYVILINADQSALDAISGRLSPDELVGLAESVESGLQRLHNVVHGDQHAEGAPA